MQFEELPSGTENSNFQLYLFIPMPWKNQLKWTSSQEMSDLKWTTTKFFPIASAHPLQRIYSNNTTESSQYTWTFTPCQESPRRNPSHSLGTMTQLFVVKAQESLQFCSTVFNHLPSCTCTNCPSHRQALRPRKQNSL